MTTEKETQDLNESETPERSRKESAIGILLFLAVLILFVGGPLSTMYSIEQESAEVEAAQLAMREKKLAYLSSEDFTLHAVEQVEWERRSQSGRFSGTADKYDVFLIQSDNQLKRIAVHDVTMDGDFYVRAYD